MGRERERSRSRSRERRRRRSRSRSRSRDRRRDRSRERRRSRSRERRRERSPDIKKEVKTEEEFDRRQERARERRNHFQRGDRDVKNEAMKREPDSPGGSSQNVFADALRGDTNDEQQWGLRSNDKEGDKSSKPKQKPDLGLSGALTAETNTYKGVVIKYSEPPEAKIPKKRWRLYPFKGEEALKVIYLHRQSAYLIGKLADICEIPVEHPSCSRQHAALQFRAVKITKPSGRTVLSVRPYIIDLESANGTYLNNEKIQPRRYYELKEQDMLKFGFSTREYIVLHEKTDTTEVHKSESESSSDSDSD